MSIRFSLFHRRRRFKGGIDLPPHRELTAGRPILEVPPPERLWVPLSLSDEPPASIVVKPGQQVKAGELLARAEKPGGVDVHAPMAGIAGGVTRVATAWRPDAPAIELQLESEGSSEHENRPRPRADLRGLEPGALADLTDRAGLVNGSLPEGLGGVLRAAAAARIRYVIVSTLDPEPMLSAGSKLALEAAEVIVSAAVAVQRCLRARHLIVAVDAADREALRRFRGLARGRDLQVVPLRNRYPQAAPALLALTLAGRRVRLGQSVLSAGVLILRAETLLQLDEAVAGKPLTHVVATVTGSALERPGHYRIAVGTPLAHVLHYVGLTGEISSIIDGGPMTGRSLSSVSGVVTKATSAILVMKPGEARIPSPGPCVRCGSCQEDCPVGIDPMSLLDLYEREAWAEVSRLPAEACIECGICSYVCPAELPLAAAAAVLKRRAEKRNAEVEQGERPGQLATVDVQGGGS